MVDNEKKLCHSNSRIFILDTTLNYISSRKVNIKQVLAEKNKSNFWYCKAIVFKRIYQSGLDWNT